MKNSESDNLSKKNSQNDYYNYKSFDFEKNIVISIVNRTLPIIFWLGLSIIFVDALNQNIETLNWNFLDGAFGFSKVFIPHSVGYLLIFYIIYSIKDIRDCLKKRLD